MTKMKFLIEKLCFWGIFAFAVSLISCASKPKYEGTANLTGLIVDEFNQPVYGFPISVSSGIKTYETAMTNESGIFLIRNVQSGMLSFSGKKEGYAVLEAEEDFCQRDKIFCFQISSVDAVLDRIDERILQEDYEGGLRELKSIYAKKGSPVYEVVCEYEKYCKIGLELGKLKELLPEKDIGKKSKKEKTAGAENDAIEAVEEHREVAENVTEAEKEFLKSEFI